jgi:thioredoxin reductase (NADPH)
MKASGCINTAAFSTAIWVAGVFAAGDMTDDIYRQAVTAAGQGCCSKPCASRRPWKPARKNTNRSTGWRPSEG